MTQNISVVPSQAELRSIMPYQHQPNQTESVNRAGAGPQQQQRVPTDNANFFIEVLQSVQHSQQQIVKEIRQMKANKMKEKGSQHDPEHVVDKEETPIEGGSQNAQQHFITMVEVTVLLEQERAKAPKERFYARRPPYPLRILSKPYPKRYETQNFAQYNGRRGSAIEHVSNFIDTLGPYMADEDLWLQEFSKSLCDQAYTQYTILKPGSISTWDNMVDMFCIRYFHGEKTVTPATLQGTKQRSNDDLMEYIKRFKDIALDYYDHCEEKTLVEMCMINTIMEYKAVLENLEISQFAQLLQKARKTAQLVRSSSDRPKEQRSTSQAMVVSIGKRKRKVDGSEYETPLPLPCTPKELDVFLDK